MSPPRYAQIKLINNNRNKPQLKQKNYKSQNHEQKHTHRWNKIQRTSINNPIHHLTNLGRNDQIYKSAAHNSQTHTHTPSIYHLRLTNRIQCESQKRQIDNPNKRHSDNSDNSELSDQKDVTIEKTMNIHW